MTRRLLVIDDHPLNCQQLGAMLELDGFEVESATDGHTALKLLRQRTFHLMITDWYMPDPNGLELVTTVRAEAMPLGVVVMTAYGDTSVALDAMKAGADDFVTKPFEPDRFRHLIHRVLDRRAMLDELEQLRRRTRSDYGFHNLVSKSPRMRRIFDLIEQVGPHDRAVLIHGETGTGKELIARAIHAVSGRRGPLIALNCAVGQESLLESELFGHERGAFTGADHQRKGKFELAHSGTLFLDEIGDISPSMQAKLLRVLQTGQFERVGGTQTLAVKVRIITASNKRLAEEVAAGRFRRDLFYRLNVIPIDLPPLRERPEDIPLLATHFLAKYRTKSTPPVTEIHPEAMQALLEHRWPGNVRELENAIKAAVAMADGTIIHRDALPATVATPSPQRPNGAALIDIDRPLPEVTNDLIGRVEREYFAQLLANYCGNVTRCARHSGLSRRSVTQKLQKYALDREEFKIRRDAAHLGAARFAGDESD